MMDFEKVHFKGTFRDYQRRVLDRTDEYRRDGKIHIVAAPGSGKTVLGLELIRRLGAPCLILSPTTAIRQQWGERFREIFLDDGEDFPSLFSYDLHRPRLFTSVTYQALYTAVEKVPPADGDETDCSDVDLPSVMREFGIATVCLDEAHHLRNEWQKALEKFVSSLGKNVRIVSLTATPPYDAEEAEWNRYIAVCGEIDEEISVPELVAQNTLCPHQDYVYFNYPTAEETEVFRRYRERAVCALEEFGQTEIPGLAYAAACAAHDEALYSYAKEYIALLTLLRYCGKEPDRKLLRKLTAGKGLPPFAMSYAETALRFLLEGDLLGEEEKEKTVAILKKHAVYEKRRVTLTLDERQKRALISSAGKLDSIRHIAENESRTMGERLRMLVLTDYIRKENLSMIASGETFSSVNVVSIFETIRRVLPDVPIGVLSGSLVILPESAGLPDVGCSAVSLPAVGYRAVTFSGSLHRAVAYVGSLFEAGKIRILVGTKSLLGEGWDSPAVNTLVLASFVGSFVLSNQMRGRAIRVDPADPDKTANIWHLATVEPEYLFPEKAPERLSARLCYNSGKLTSCDFDLLRRRFDTFVGPGDASNVIESGIERLTVIRPPFDRKGIARINDRMLALSADRASVRDKWRGEVADGKFTFGTETEVPHERRVPVFTFFNMALYTMLVSMQVFLLRTTIDAFLRSNLRVTLFGAAAVLLLLPVYYFGIKKILLFFNPARSVKTLGTAVWKTLCDCGRISPNTWVETEAHKSLYYVSLRLRNASVHDQNVFNSAMTEMLSPIGNPRYLMIARRKYGGYRFRLSFACPSVIGRKAEYAEILAGHLRMTTERFVPVYTRSEEGRRLLLRCRRRSYITENEKAVNRRYKVTHWE